MTVDELTWSNDRRFTLRGTEFQVVIFGSGHSQPDRFVLAKTPELIAEYAALIPEMHGGRIVELGIHEGGSTALFAHMYDPAALLAVDITEAPNAALQTFLDEHGYRDRVHAVYGVDQGVEGELLAPLDRYLGPEPLDLVVDDASHYLAPTLVSFRVLFPRLRPGGLFVIEDWSHGHTGERILRSVEDQVGAAAIAEHAATPPERRDLTRLVLQLVTTVGFAPESVAEIRIHNGLALVRRGDAVLDPATFEIGDLYGDVARADLGPGS